jgi:hypothetical protein
MKIQIGAKEFDARPPDSYATARDVLMASGRSLDRALCAALGVTIPALVRRLRVAPYEHDYSALAFGGRIMDALHREGVPMSDLYEPGGSCLTLCSEMAITEKEVAAAEVPTEPPTGG